MKHTCVSSSKVLCFVFIVILGIPLKNVLSDEIPTKNCFQKHLQIAIDRNRERLERYSELSSGQTERISNTLVTVERMAMPTAFLFDQKAKKYHRAGINLLCDELIDLDFVPPFQDRALPYFYEPKEFVTSHPFSLSSSLSKALSNGNHREIASIAKAKLAELSTRPSFNCLMRNDLNTIYKTAKLVDEHEKKAHEVGAPCPRALSYSLLNSMILSLPVVDHIDHIAFEVQKQGIPIICQDFPGSRMSP